jgi:hypothetical protein
MCFIENMKKKHYPDWLPSLGRYDGELPQFYMFPRSHGNVSFLLILGSLSLSNIFGSFGEKVYRVKPQAPCLLYGA